jgi:hypothetical protein
MEDTYLSQQVLQSELLPGETLLWSGQPSRRVIFHKEDAMLIPFSLMWGGFAIFWEIGASGGFSSHIHGPGNAAGWLFPLWGIPFIVIGQYLIWGRFLYAAWKKGRIFYGLTQKRVLILDSAWSRSLNAAYVDQIPVIEKTIRADGIGTLRFGYPPPQTGRRNTFSSSLDSLGTSGVPCFVDVENAESVYATVAELREKTTAARE